MRNKIYLTAPYLLILCSLIVIFGLSFSVNFFVNLDENWPDYSGGIFVPFLTVAFMIVVILDGREILSFYTVKNNMIRFYTPFRKTIVMDLRKCLEIGIDYGIISGGMKQFWIYFSVEPVPYSYHHRITRVKYTKEFLRVQYSDEVYEIILGSVSNEIKNRLIAAHSVIDNLKRKGDNDHF